jgi:hypothetical protein
VQSFLKHYRHEFQYMIEHPGRSIVEAVTGSPPTGAAADAAVAGAGAAGAVAA